MNNEKKLSTRTSMDHPEQYNTKKTTLFEQHETEQHVDPIPVEDLNQEVKDEKNKKRTKKDSSSEDKYHSGF
ncbi:hypothetical protein [Metabacillus iocasae]|uniref:Vesicle coat complex subunit n=1 Tax=Priestia iocasae TaxID=2291674 RepID=A0ABS2QYL2_9BACI|nr:hypothetical protein [Metabacillus iocasae]MBM7704283.1 vesicle coat complex subunit [Metabacillus iocasae]